MGSKETVKLNVVIAGRSYPLVINAGEEERITRLVKELNSKISDFKVRYTDKDTQDHLSMALLTVYNDLDKVRQSSSDQQAIKRLTDVEGQLSELLD